MAKGDEGTSLIFFGCGHCGFPCQEKMASDGLSLSLSLNSQGLVTSHSRFDCMFNLDDVKRKEGAVLCNFFLNKMLMRIGNFYFSNRSHPAWLVFVLCRRELISPPPPPKKKLSNLNAGNPSTFPVSISSQEITTKKKCFLLLCVFFFVSCCFRIKMLIILFANKKQNNNRWIERLAAV